MLNIHNYNKTFQFGGLVMLDSSKVDEQIRKTLHGINSYPLMEKSICVEISLLTNDGDRLFLETWDITFDPNSIDMSVIKPQHIYTRMGK